MLVHRFTYQLLQGFDFVHLARHHSVQLQVPLSYCCMMCPDELYMRLFVANISSPSHSCRHCLGVVFLNQPAKSIAVPIASWRSVQQRFCQRSPA